MVLVWFLDGDEGALLHVRILHVLVVEVAGHIQVILEQEELVEVELLIMMDTQEPMV